MATVEHTDEAVTDDVVAATENLRIDDDNNRTSNTGSESPGTADLDQTVTRPDRKLVGFDLANPDDVVEMLETVELSEEDTDALLQEAYKVNKKLKEVLRRQDRGHGEGEGSYHRVYIPASHDGPTVVNVMAISKTTPNSFSKTAVLPPISHGGSRLPAGHGIYSAKIPRAPNHSATRTGSGAGARSAHHAHSDIRRRSPEKPDSAKSRRTQHGRDGSHSAKADGPRPPWNDRFSC